MKGNRLLVICLNWGEKTEHFGEEGRGTLFREESGLLVDVPDGNRRQVICLKAAVVQPDSFEC